MLEGLKVIEIEGLGPAPFAGMLLADLGCDVIVVHREKPPIAGMEGKNLLDRGKRSVVLDLKKASDIERLKALVASADGIIEGFRPGVMERLGIGPSVLCEQNPRLVYGRMTGWGQDGPHAHLAGHDLNYIALSGALWYASPENQPPFTPPTLVGDIAGGALYLVNGMLSGFIRAMQTGKGTVVDAAIVDGSAHTMNLMMSMHASGMFAMQRGQSLLDGSHWSRCYLCSDGKWMAVQCFEPKFYKMFLEKLGLHEEADFQQQHNVELWPILIAKLSACFVAKPQSHWANLFLDCDACVTPVLSPLESKENRHMQARSIWVESEGFLQARSAPRFDDQVPKAPASIPERGEHTEVVFSS